MSKVVSGASERRAKACERGRVAGRFVRDENGSLIIFSLYLLVIMLIVAGMGVDLMYAESRRMRLQSTLDRAVLAGASLSQGLNSQAVVLDYFAREGLSGAINASDITVTATATGKTVSAGASIPLNTFFLGLAGITQLQAPAMGAARENVTDVEISLVVDVSGSMGGTSSSGNTKIDDLKNAAKEFVYAMQCDPDSATTPFAGPCTVAPDKVSITLVPYNQQVLAGEALLDQFDVTQEHSYSSCMDFNPSDFTQAALALNPTVIDPSNAPNPAPSLPRSAPIAAWGNGLAVDALRVCNPDLKRRIRPYVADYNILFNAIDDLYAQGNTSIEIGMKWGTALLDPSFQPGLANMAQNLGLIDTAFLGRPFSYTRPDTRKVIVLMTDGKNTTHWQVKAGLRAGPSPFWVDDQGKLSLYDPAPGQYYHVASGSFGPSPDGDQSTVQQLAWPEFWETYSTHYYSQVVSAANHSTLPANPTTAVGSNTKDVRLDAMCDAAKAKGITIYTVGFEAPASSQAIMKDCATEDSYYFDVNGTTISHAFQSIARNINALRLIN